MYWPNFLDGFDRLVAFDAETTGKRTPDAEFIRKQPFAWESPWHHRRSRFRRNAALWRKGEMWTSRVNRHGPITLRPSRSTAFAPPTSKTLQGFPTILPKVKDSVRKSPIVAPTLNKNERDFLNYEFARAKVFPWGESAYADERYICTQVLFAQLFPGASTRLLRCAIDWCLTAAKETTGTAHRLTLT